MSQHAWNVKPEGGRRWTIGLYHGDETGHVMVYINNVITQVDFSVRDDRTYSMLLDNELCQVTITKESDGSFSYNCQLDEEKMAAKRAERERAKELEAKHERQRVQFAFGIIAFILLVAWWMSI